MLTAIERYAKQTGKQYRFSSSDNAIDSYIEAREKVKAMIVEQEQQKAFEKEIEIKIEEMLEKAIDNILKKF